MPRTGVFICWCGSNIAKTVDVERVAASAKSFPGVVHSSHYKYMCSDPGQNLILEAIREYHLERVVVGACSPSLHEATFQACLGRGGLNPYLFEMANIREQCSWVHHDTGNATEKAIQAVRMAVAKASRSRPLFSSELPVEKRALVIGGGIAGIQAALDIAEAGHPVVILERTPSIGGRMAQFDKTFPTLDCSACILTPKMVEAARHPNISLYTYSEVESVSGFVGNFEVKIRKRARSIDMKKCTGCGLCYAKCPTKIPSEFEEGMGKRGAIYVPFPQAVPNVPVIDRKTCIYFTKNRCRLCEKICPGEAVNFEEEDEVLTQRFGAIVVATGNDLFDPSVYTEYGGGEFPDVITGMQLERMINVSGPTGGTIQRPSNGKEPETVVLIKCVGSRDDAKGFPYCSRVCCMYTAKHAILLREKLSKARIFVFYMDVRTAGKAYEEFYRRAVEEHDVSYVRGKVSKIYPSGDRLIVQGSDTILGKALEMEADLVVLATGATSRRDAKDLARLIGIQTDQFNFFSEAHAKLRPVETLTAGIFLAGACQYPRDIPDSVASAGAAAAKVCALLSRDRLYSLPTVAEVKAERCSGCFSCREVCPYNAIEEEEYTDRLTRKKRMIARVNTAVCQGCGACTAACNTAAIDLCGFSNEQILREIDACIVGS